MEISSWLTWYAWWPTIQKKKVPLMSIGLKIWTPRVQIRFFFNFAKRRTFELTSNLAKISRRSFCHTRFARIGLKMKPLEWIHSFSQWHTCTYIKTHYHTIPHFDALTIAVENIVRKWEIACNKQFLLFSQCFLPYIVLIFHFKCTLECHLQFVSIRTSPIFRRLLMD